MRIEIKLILLLLQLTLLQSCSYGGPAQDAGESIHDPEQSNNDAPLSAYQFVYSFKNGFAIVVTNKKYGFIDKKGRNVIPCKYDYAHDFSNGFALVKQGEKYGYIDSTGKEITPMKYDFGHDFLNGRAVVKLDDGWGGLGGKWGFIDEHGKEIIPVVCDYVSEFSEEVTTIQDNDQWFIVDKMNNRKPISHITMGTSGFHDGLASIEQMGKRGCIDKQGNIVIKPKYDMVYYFEDGLALVELNDKYGFINRKGQEVIPLLYEGYPHFSDGLAAVSINDLYGFIDKTGKVVIPLQYKDVYSFYDGLAQIRVNGKSGCINHKGETVIPMIYDEILVGEGVLGVIDDEKGQFLDLKGNVLFPEVYEDLYGFSDGAALVKQNGNWFFIDKQGKRLF